MATKAKKCKYCKEEIDRKATVCPHCQKKQGAGCLNTLVGIVLVLLIGGFLLSRCSSFQEGYKDAKENSKISSEASKYSEEDYKKACRTVTFEEIARDKNALKGEKVMFTGEVVQVMDDLFRVDITKTEYGYTDTIAFDIDTGKLSENILEGDIVTIWGESKGFYTYTSILNQEITIPRVRAVYIQNSGKTEQ
jgi:RecJ-like exonuclease